MRYSTVFLLAVVVIAALSAAPVSGGNYTRVTATGTITTMPTDAYNMIWESIGGNRSPTTEEETKVNWTKLLSGHLLVYNQIIGYLALILIVASPFVAMWLMQSDMVPASVAFIIIGGFLLLFVPSQFSLLAGVFIALAIVTVIYSLMKERM